MNQVKIFIIVIVVLVMGVLTLALIGPSSVSQNSTKYDAFAQCLADSGATFYGAFWCPHCANQKKMFGASQRLLPYVECSTPNGQAQTPACIEAGIEGYPTWEFADGSRMSGEVSLETLASVTGCVLPDDADTLTSAEEGVSSNAIMLEAETKEEDEQVQQ